MPPDLLVVGESRRDGSELLGAFQKGIDDVRVEMLVPTLPDHRHRLFVRQGRFVNPPADQSVVHVGHRHQPRRQRNLFAPQPFGIAAAVPFFLMGIGDFPSEAQEGIGGVEIPLGGRDGIAPQCGMGLHDLEFVRGQSARLEQDAVGNPHLADIVQRRRLEQQFDGFVVQGGGEAGVMAKMLGQRPDIVLGAADVVAGGVVAGFRQRSHRHDGDFLNRHHLATAAPHLRLQIGIAVLQELPGAFQRQMRFDPGQHDRWADRFGDVVHRA